MKQHAEKVPGGYLVEGRLYKEEELRFWHVVAYPFSGGESEHKEVTAEEWDEIVESGIESKWVEVRGENLYAEGMIRTQSGIYYDIVRPTPDMICLEDIHHALNRVPRFAGHTKHPWTVADHCVAMAKGEREESNTVKLWLLMHDASEAYLGDIPGPLKRLLGDYAVLEKRCMSAIAEKFGLEQGFWKDPRVKAADREALEYEWNGLVLKEQRWIGDGMHWLRLVQKLLGV